MNEVANIGLLPFQAMEMAARAKTLEAEGRNICHLETGEPAAPPAPRVLEAMRCALAQPQGYTQSTGRAELRRALAGYYQDRHGVSVDPESIIVTMGSSAGFILAFLAGFAPKSTIAVTRPGYPAYLNTIAGLGYKPVEIALEAANGWRLTAAEVEKAHARQPFAGLLFASPANPTGASVERAEFEAIIKTCRRLGVRFISDEIYHGLEFGTPSASAVEFGDDAVIINSFSKYFCMTGWRIGWMVMPPDLLAKTTMLQQSLFIAAPSLGQTAAVVALEERHYYDAQKELYAENQRVLAAGLSELGFEAIRPVDGAFYCYGDISRFSNDSLAFSRNLLEAAGVCTTPGIDFDRINGNRFVRFSFAGQTPMIKTALERIAGFVTRRSD